jgi:hypothetical protein
LKKALFAPKKSVIGPKLDLFLITFLIMSSIYLGPTTAQTAPFTLLGPTTAQRTPYSC